MLAHGKLRVQPSECKDESEGYCIGRMHGKAKSAAGSHKVLLWLVQVQKRKGQVYRKSTLEMSRVSWILR